MTEAYWANDDATESISTHAAKAKEVCYEMARADHDLRCGKRIAIAEKSNTKRLQAKR
jgi:hypothetical protein